MIGQVCENNWIRRIVGEKREDKRRKDKLRVKVGVMDSFKKKLAEIRLKLFGHMRQECEIENWQTADAQKVYEKMR